MDLLQVADYLGGTRARLSRHSAMTALAVQNRASQGRWAISAAVVLLLHLAIAAALLATWRRSREIFPPVVIELAPPPVPDRPTTVPPAPPPATSSAPPQRTIEPNPAVRGDEKAEPRRPAEVAPPASAPPAGAAGGERPGTRAAPTAPPAPPSAGNPIDLRMAEPSRLRFRRGTQTQDWRKTILSRPVPSAGPSATAPGVGTGPAPPLGTFATRHRPFSPLGPRPSALGPVVPGGGVARNSVGIPMQEIGAAPSAKGGHSDVRTLRANAAVGVARNAVGAPAIPRRLGSGPALPAASATGGIHPGIGSVASTGAPTVAAGVNGTHVIRPGTGAGVIGGPSKPAGGVVNGTTFRRR
jgi:hypothetical protein